MHNNIKITPIIAEYVFHCYVSMKNAREYARGISQDLQAHPILRREFVAVAASLNGAMERLERRVPKEAREDFSQQMKDTDHIRLDNIKSLYARMIPAQQELLEALAQAVVNKEIQVEQIEDPVEVSDKDLA